jgi:hypothetical protein
MNTFEDTGSRLHLDGYVDSGLDLSGRSILQITSVGSHLDHARFDGVYISHASFGAGRSVSTYTDCSFDGATIYFGPGGFARFVRCTFRDARLANWLCHAVELVGCAFSGQIEGAVFNGTVPTPYSVIIGRDRNEFVDNDFSRATLVDVAFRTGIDLRRQRLPDGPDYVLITEAAKAITRAKERVAHWPDEPHQQAAVAFLKALEFEAQGGQRDLFLQLATYPNADRGLVMELAGLSAN